MTTKLILQVAITALVLAIGSGVLPASMSVAEAFQPAPQIQRQHATQQGVP